MTHKRGEEDHRALLPHLLGVRVVRNVFKRQVAALVLGRVRQLNDAREFAVVVRIAIHVENVVVRLVLALSLAVILCDLVVVDLADMHIEPITVGPDGKPPQLVKHVIKFGIALVDEPDA